VLQWAKPSGLLEIAVRVNDERVQFYLDTGAEVNIINKDTFDYIGAPDLQNCDEVARMYNGQTATTYVFYVAPRDL
jgi:predicted aspartyl protease